MMDIFGTRLLQLSIKSLLNQIVTVIDKEFVMINTFYIYLPLYLSYLFFVSPFLFDKDVRVLF